MVDNEEEREEKKEKRKPIPFNDEAFKSPSFDFGSVEDRRRFEQNLIKYDVVRRNETLIVETTIGSPLVIPPYGTASGQTGEVRFKELAGYGDNYVGFNAPDSVGTSVVWTLPESDGQRNQFLQTNGSRQLVWGWPYWVKIGNDVYYPNGNVGINKKPVDNFDSLGAINTDEQYKIDSQVVLHNPGTENIFCGVGIGTGTGAGLPDTLYNTVMGFEAGYKLQAGANDNSLFGNWAGYGITTGFDNTCIGFLAGYGITTGYNNICIGANAGEEITQGYNNILIGLSTGGVITTGYENICIGLRAGDEITTGYDNICIGANAGYLINGGYENICIGDMAGWWMTTGYENICVGFKAGWNINTGYYNTCVGLMAGNAITTQTGNVFIGYKAGYYETGSNSFFIDNQQRSSQATGRTSALMYGTFNATVANQTLAINAKLSTRYQFTSSLVTGTSPFSIASTTVCTNLNADMVDGVHGTSLAPTHKLLDGTWHTDSLAGTVVLGDLIHGNTTPKWARLAGNTTTTKKYLVQTGTGTISAVPAWDTIAWADVSKTGSNLTDLATRQHAGLTEAGTNTHAQIDSYISSSRFIQRSWFL